MTRAIRQIGCLIGKDLRIEARNRQTLGLVAVLGILIVTVLGLGLGTQSNISAFSATAVLWVAYLFSGVLCFEKTFAVERNDGVLSALLMAPIDRGVIYVAKLMSNLLLILAVAVVVTPAGVLFFAFDLSAAPGTFVGVMALSIVGFAAVGTLFAAMVSSTRLQGGLLAMLVFPITLPLVLVSTQLMMRVFRDGLSIGGGAVGVLVAFDLIFLTVSWLVFEWVLEPQERTMRRCILKRAYWLLTFVLFGCALAMVAFRTPDEETMGVIQKIFYLHLPVAIATFLACAVCFVASIGYAWKRDMSWDRLASAAAGVSVIFCSVVLLTGMIWGRSAWNQWWTWSPRLTFSLVLWLLYVVYLMTRASVESRERRAIISAVYGIVAFLDVPLVYLSVRLMPDIHPSSVQLAAPMRLTLMVWFAPVLMLAAGLIATRFAIDTRAAAKRDEEPAPPAATGRFNWSGSAA